MWGLIAIVIVFFKESDGIPDLTIFFGRLLQNIVDIVRCVLWPTMHRFEGSPKSHADQHYTY